MIKDKIIPREKLKTILDNERESGKTIVFANGCFDVLHVGHIRYLKDAGALGDILVTAVNSDNSVKLIKGNYRPILPEEDRALLVAAMKHVDYVTLFPEPDAIATMRMLRPHIQAKGTDYTEDTVPERYVMEELGGKVAITGDPKDHSTKSLISLVKEKF